MEGFRWTDTARRGRRALRGRRFVGVFWQTGCRGGHCPPVFPKSADHRENGRAMCAPTDAVFCRSGSINRLYGGTASARCRVCWRGFGGRTRRAGVVAPYGGGGLSACFGRPVVGADIVRPFSPNRRTIGRTGAQCAPLHFLRKNIFFITLLTFVCS